jgi:predicted DNA-binding transcriptional regulator YafY
LLSPPEHQIEPDDVRALLAATELRGSCRLKYQSMTSTEASERVVCPHAVVKASGRYHVRAFDFSRKRFRDFSLSRVLSSDSLPDHAPVPSTLDDDWHKTVEVEFVPHPRLSPTQRSKQAILDRARGSRAQGVVEDREHRTDRQAARSLR